MGQVRAAVGRPSQGSRWSWDPGLGLGTHHREAAIPLSDGSVHVETTGASSLV